MTDQPPPPPPSQGSGGGSGGGGMDFGSLSQGEKLVGVGGLAVLAVYVIFELITEDYFVSDAPILLAAFIVAVLWIRLQRPGTTLAIPSNSLLRAAGYLLLVWGVVEFIDGLKDEIFEFPGATVAAFLILVGGSALAGWGAKQLD